MPSSPINGGRQVLMCLLACLAMIVSSGCAMLINPFHEDLPTAARVTTASASVIRESSEVYEIRHRDWSPTVLPSLSQSVAHWPLYWSDPFVDRGSDEGRFAWSWEELLAFFYCPARYAVNTIALPASLIVDSPFSVRCSDGYLSPQTFGRVDHDPIRCSGDEILPDVVEAYRFPL